MKWQVGVTTCPARCGSLLPRTICSLRAGGFGEVRLFMDGARGGCEMLDCPITYRHPALLTVGNWLLSLMELWLRDPRADRYAMFQDDCVTCRNLRQYLEAIPHPPKGYCNLFTFPHNQALIDSPADGKGRVGWHQSNQQGLGAVGLVFSNEAVELLLTSRHLIAVKPKGAGDRATKCLDGGIVTALGQHGFREWVHNPSLIQHVGADTTMTWGSKPNAAHPAAPSFRGEGFNALELLKERPVVSEDGFGKRRFCGCWQVRGSDGKPVMVLTIGESLGGLHAVRQHVPDAPGRGLLIGDGVDRVLVSWPDGFRDVLEVDGTGSCWLLALGRDPSSWDSPPLSRLRAVKVG